jgi:hypothetical protein
MVERVRDREEYTYRCQYCKFENVREKMPQSSVAVTKRGDYGNRGTPTPEVFADTLYEDALTIAFVAAAGTVPAKITDSAYRFGEKCIRGGMSLRVATDSGVNDGDYTIAARGVSRGEILLSSTDSLTTEAAAAAGEVTLSRLIYQPNVQTGCPFCGSLNSR